MTKEAQSEEDIRKIVASIIEDALGYLVPSIQVGIKCPGHQLFKDWVADQILNKGI